MTIRVILAPLSGGAASEGAIETACRLGARFGAHVAALHVKLDTREAMPLLGQDVAAPVAEQLIEMAARESREGEARAQAFFEAAAARHGLPFRTTPGTAGEPSASWRVETGRAPAIVPLRARLADLVVLGQSGRVADQPHSDTLEETLLQGGRPVLLAPARALAPLGETIAIAWNGAPEAARAVSAALPFLATARAVHVLRAGQEAGEGPDLEAYLAWHGIAATAQPVQPVEGVGVGELVLAAAREVGADLLVMGGYGRAPWREMIFGGATREIVATSRLPLLLAH